MTGGLMQLVAYGEQNLFLTKNPQITFFKAIYRRHTNFSIEQIPQTFIHKPNFGKRVSCIVSKSGDLMGNIFLMITLPTIPQLYYTDGTIDNLTKFAWIRKIGYGIVKEVEVEIGGQIIDKHYGHWLNIWGELNGQKDEDINKTIGNIPELYQFSSKKREYKLYIPLQFWFCRTAGLALPIMCLQYNDVKINIELSDFETCHIISPTHYIPIQNDIINLTPFEYIYQKVGTYEAFGIFSYYDMANKRLYYIKISQNSLIAINNSDFYGSSYTDTQRQSLIDEYSIQGTSSNYHVCPRINTSSTTVTSVSCKRDVYKNIRIKECYLLINYIYLGDEERQKFYKSTHEFLIEQLIYTGTTTLDGISRSVKVGLINPCKLMVWTTQFNYLLNNNVNDLFNFTDSYIYDTTTQKQIGDSIILNSTILFNGIERMAQQDDIYYNNIQPYQYFKYGPSAGIHIYSFGLIPDQTQPSGSCNTSKIDNIQINLKLFNGVSTTTPVIFKCYGLTINILKISSGIGGIIFTK